MNEQFKDLDIIFIPEFLREGSAIYDNLYPSRIIIGIDKKKSKHIEDVFISISLNKPLVYFMNSTEAESVKLFSNAYLAVRVSFFNELDSYCLANELNTLNIINGVSADKRIGDAYNNPSFGYGGYCLPKDTKQLVASFKDTPQEIFDAVIRSNISRKEYITKFILDKRPEIVGIYRLIMKSNSDNYRESPVFDIIDILKMNKIKVIVYEPIINNSFENMNFINSLEDFKKQSDLILANRITDDLNDVTKKVFSRDLFKNN